MLDPKEQAKGGFRAFAAREQERRDFLAGAQREADAAGADARAAAGGQADGTPAADARAADDARSPYAPSADPRGRPSP